MDCIFCKIANKEIPTAIVYEDEEILVFRSIKPEAPLHLIIIPKKHIEWQNDFQEDDLKLFSKLIKVAKEIAKENKVDHACKLMFNIGKTGHIKHIHLHLLAGWPEPNIPKRNI